MSREPQIDAPSVRYGAYAVLIALSLGNMTGRLLAVNSTDVARLESYRYRHRLDSAKEQWREEGLSNEEIEQRTEELKEKLERKEFLQRPFLSSNDRSRWATVRALVEHQTYEIDRIVAERQWDTIDMVKHKNRAGQGRLYSSKPPLLPTLIAGEYWLLQKLTGWTLGTHPYELGRIMLFTINIIPAGIMLWLIALLAERYGTSDWGRIFVVGAASLGTFLSTFAVVLNNHLVAAVSATVALYATLKICDRREQRPLWFILAGLFAAFTAANELPALSFFGLVSLALLARAPKPTLLIYTPAAALIVAAFFATNYIAHDSLRPPYMHRIPTDPDDNWYHYTYQRDIDEEGNKTGKVRESYWLDRQGIDVGEKSRATYALHVLVGHHGVFSLTPIWILSFLGMLYWIAASRFELRTLAGSVLFLSVLCIVFYVVFRPQVDRNYGGMSSGFRWLFWFAPLWLVTMLPTVDRMSRSRTLWVIALLLLAWSVMSAAYPVWNPWRHPWITDWMLWNEWIEFG